MLQRKRLTIVENGRCSQLIQDYMVIFLSVLVRQRRNIWWIIWIIIHLPIIYYFLWLIKVQKDVDTLAWRYLRKKFSTNDFPSSRKNPAIEMSTFGRFWHLFDKQCWLQLHGIAHIICSSLVQGQSELALRDNSFY